MWEVSWRLNKQQLIDPPVPLSLATLLPRSAGQLNRGSCVPIALCLVLVHSTASYLQLTDPKLTEPASGPGLYNCLSSTYFLWMSHLHLIQPVHSQGYTQISSTGCTCSLIAAGSKVNMLQYLIVRLYMDLPHYLPLSPSLSLIFQKSIVFRLIINW